MTMPTFVAHQRVKASDLQIISDYLTAVDSSWSTWSPTLSSITLGNGTVVARYKQVGKTVHFYFKFTYGSSGSVVASDVRITLPVTGHADMNLTPGLALYRDASPANNYYGPVLLTTAQAIPLTSASPAVVLSGTAPFTWAVGDALTITGTYEAA